MVLVSDLLVSGVGFSLFRLVIVFSMMLLVGFFFVGRLNSMVLMLVLVRWVVIWVFMMLVFSMVVWWISRELDMV